MPRFEMQEETADEFDRWAHTIEGDDIDDAIEKHYAGDFESYHTLESDGIDVYFRELDGEGDAPIRKVKVSGYSDFVIRVGIAKPVLD